MSKKAYIISGFPGVGKSHMAENEDELKCLDCESSEFSWLYNEEGSKERHPEFPDNYIDFVLSNIDKYDYIFVSSHDSVRKALYEKGIEYVIVYPGISLKDPYLARYRKRGNDEAFIEMMNKNWNKFIMDIESDPTPYKIMLMHSDSNLCSSLKIAHKYYNGIENYFQVNIK